MQTKNKYIKKNKKNKPYGALICAFMVANVKNGFKSDMNLRMG